RNTRYGRLVRPSPSGTFTLKETSSFACRTNDERWSVGTIKDVCNDERSSVGTISFFRHGRMGGKINQSKKTSTSQAGRNIAIAHCTGWRGGGDALLT
ncbi:MAG: hypothetical protein WC091_21915, partial [Sulfuricellaceae bacterium]